MKKLLLRAGLGLAGMAVMLTWWTIHPGASNGKSQDTIPAKVGAGGNNFEIAVESSSAATMRVGFEDLSKPSGSQQVLESWEKIPAGSRTWNVDVPAGLGGYVEIEAEGPKAGDTLTMDLKMNGDSVDHQSERLNGDLEANMAFFLQDHFDDYSKAKQEMSGASGGSEP